FVALWFGPDWNSVGNGFRDVRWSWVAVAIAINLASIVSRSIAWTLVIDQALTRPPRFRLVFSAFSVGLLANAVLPGRIGELGRAHPAGWARRGPARPRDGARGPGRDAPAVAGGGRDLLPGPGLGLPAVRGLHRDAGVRHPRGRAGRSARPAGDERCDDHPALAGERGRGADCDRDAARLVRRGLCGRDRVRLRAAGD